MRAGSDEAPKARGPKLKRPLETTLKLGPVPGRDHLVQSGAMIGIGLTLQPVLNLLKERVPLHIRCARHLEPSPL